jgi:hypothetical protein
VLPLSRRDVERIHQVLMLQRRLREPSRAAHARRVLTLRTAFADALTWLEIHGDAPETLVFWRSEGGAPAEGGGSQPRRRRRRRRNRSDFPSRKAPE